MSFQKQETQPETIEDFNTNQNTDGLICKASETLKAYEGLEYNAAYLGKSMEQVLNPGIQVQATQAQKSSVSNVTNANPF